MYAVHYTARVYVAPHLSRGSCCSCSVSQGGYTSTGGAQLQKSEATWRRVQLLFTITTLAKAPAIPYARAKAL
jgi:hypothetical protein